MNRSPRPVSAPLLAIAALTAAMVAGCYLKPFLVDTGLDETLLVVHVLDPQTNEPAFIIYSSGGGDLVEWKRISSFNGKVTAATWYEGRLWVFHGVGASAYSRTEEGFKWEPTELSLDWEVMAAVPDRAGALWCVGSRNDHIVALRLTDGPDEPELFTGPGIGPGTHYIDCAWDAGALLVAWRAVKSDGGRPTQVELSSLADGTWSATEKLDAPKGRVALAGSGTGAVMLVLGRPQVLAGGSILYESLRDEAGWTSFTEVPGTETTLDFGYLALSASRAGDGVVCVRTNTQRLQILVNRDGEWRVVESPGGLPEGNVQLYVGAMLLLAASLLVAGAFSFIRWYRGGPAPVPPPGWSAVAPVSRRGLAYAADFFLLVPVMVITLDATGLDLPTLAARPAIQVALYLLPLAYFVITEALFGATVGKHLMGVRVVMADGSRVTPLAALVRNALRVADGLPPTVLIPVIGLIVISLTKRRQRIGDLLAQTTVVAVEKREIGGRSKKDA